MMAETHESLNFIEYSADLQLLSSGPLYILRILRTLCFLPLSPEDPQDFAEDPQDPLSFPLGFILF